MTASEERKIDLLRRELSEYHVQVREHITRCESCRADVHAVMVDLYGRPGDKDRNPGVLTDLAGLKKSRRNLLIAIGSLWSLIVAVAGGVTTFLLG